MCVYIYIYIYSPGALLIEPGLCTAGRPLEEHILLLSETIAEKQRELGDRRGTNGVSTNGVAANFRFFNRGTFWVLPLTCFYIPKGDRAYLFPQSVKHISVVSGPISVDPIFPQPIS